MEHELVRLAIVQIFFWAAVAFGMVALKNKKLQDIAPFFSSSLPEIDESDRTSFFSDISNAKEAFGVYGGAPLYRYVDIEGKPYVFDRILLSGDLVIMERGERCVAPGLVYREYRADIA